MTTNPITDTAATTRILVVDDSEASRYLTTSWLRRHGYQVTEATTGTQALALLGEQRQDVVLLDVNLPDMSGFEVCERIKADARTAAIPVIHVSATSVEIEDKEQGLSRGADAYLVEPVDPRELVATVEAALRYYRARAVAENLARRLTQLTEIMLLINTATTFDDVLTAAAAGARAMFGGPVTVMTVTPRGRVRTAVAEAGDSPPALRHEPAETIRNLRQSTHDEGPGPFVATRSGLTWHATPSATTVTVFPKPSQEPVCIAVGRDAISGEEERHLLLQLGQMAAVACESLRAFTEEHTLALTLQRGLLPHKLPDVPALSMAARYVPASRNAEIGGDFYEVADLDGRLLIAIGDVVGHSIEAAMVMGEVRHALRAYAVEGHEPAAILDRLDTMIQRFHPTGFTTMCLMFVDPVTGAAEVANAGHVPPLLAVGDDVRYVPARGPLLGVGWSRPRPTEIVIPRDALVLLVTDGLVENRRRPVGDGMDALLAAVSPHDDLEPLCDRLLDELGGQGDDDIAMLAFRRL